VNEERDAVKPLARSTFVTPGMTDRKIGPMGSTTRRFVNLAQFGGPARRVKPGEEVVEDEQPKTPVRTRKSPFKYGSMTEYQHLHPAITLSYQSLPQLNFNHKPKLVPPVHQSQNQSHDSYIAVVPQWSGGTVKNLLSLRSLSTSNRRLVGIGSGRDHLLQSTRETIDQGYHRVSRKKRLVQRILGMRVGLNDLYLKSDLLRHTVLLILRRRRPFPHIIRPHLVRSSSPPHQLLCQYKVKSGHIHRLHLYHQQWNHQGKWHLLHHRLSPSWTTTSAGSS